MQFYQHLEARSTSCTLAIFFVVPSFLIFPPPLQIVGPILSSQASLLETISNNFFGLPLVTPSASAARAETYFTSGANSIEGGASYLFGVQPDIFEQMNALTRLILDMKTERDSLHGWCEVYETDSKHLIYCRHNIFVLSLMLSFDFLFQGSGLVNSRIVL